MITTTTPRTHARLHKNPTRAEEIEHLAEIVDSLPDGYLRDIFSQLKPGIEQAIRNDVGFVDFSRLIMEQVEEQKKLRELVECNKRELEAARRLRAEIDKARSALAMICEDAEFIARKLKDYQR